MNNYSFSTSEANHAQFIGETFRRTRMLRRALLHKLTGQEYAEMPASTLLEMDTRELMAALNVVLEKQHLEVRPPAPITHMRQEAQARQAAHMFPGGYGPGSRSRVAKRKGLPMNGGAYGYIRNAQGRYEPVVRLAEILRRGFAIAAEDGYTAAGSYLNEQEVFTPTGLTWSKDTARDFFRNTIYAGYVKEYKQNRKRGPIVLYPAWQVEALISLQDWIAANLRYACTQQIEFPYGFLTPVDETAWQERHKAGAELLVEKFERKDKYEYFCTG